MYNVLFVDDEIKICRGLSIIIDWSKYGFSILSSASNGREAIQKIKENKVDLVITDIRMPVMDGLELSKQIRDINLDTRIIIISGYNEFSYAQKAIEYGVRAFLLKPLIPEELIEQVLNIKRELDKEEITRNEEIVKIDAFKNKLILDFICGVSDIKYVENCLVKYEMSFESDSYNVALVCVDNRVSKNQIELEDYQMKKKDIRKAIEDYIKQFNLGYVYDDDGLIGILLLGKGIFKYNKNNIHEILKLICNNISERFEVNAVIGYGSAIESPHEIRRSRNEAKKVLRSNGLQQESRVISYENYLYDKSLWVDLKLDFKGLIDAVEDANRDSIEYEISKLTNSYHFKNLLDEIAQGIVISIMIEMSNLIEKYNGESNLVFNYDTLDEIQNVCTDIKLLESWLIKKCHDVSEYTIMLSVKKQDNVISHILEYIDEYYYKDISLSLLGKLFYINAAYLGQLFKNTQGITFCEYINKKRIEKFKLLYKTSNMRISSIIEKVGFNNSEHFYRQFKRFEGIAFAEWKEQYKKYQILCT